MSDAINTWPEKIWLQTDEDDSELQNFNTYAEVTWCSEKQNEFDVEYFRVHQIEQQRDELLAALSYLIEMIEPPPDANCSCHIAPPCNDCVEYGGLRNALGQAKDAIAKVEQS